MFVQSYRCIPRSLKNQTTEKCHLKKISCPQIIYCDSTIEKGQKEAEPFRDKLSRNVCKKLPLLSFVSLVERNLQPTSFKWCFWIHDLITSQNFMHSKVLTWTTKGTVACWRVWQTGSWRASTLPQYTSSHYLSFRRGCTQLHDWPCSLLLVDVLHQVGHSPLHVPPLLLFLLSNMNYLSCTVYSLNRTGKSTSNKAGRGRISPSIPFDTNYLISKWNRPTCF